MNKKPIMVAIAFIIMGIALISTGTVLTFKEKNRNNLIKNPPSREENKEDSIGRKEEDVQEVQIEGENVTSQNINLNDYSSNIIISDGGEYNLTGNFSNSLYINSEETVTLNLNGININSKKDSAIANVGTKELIINVNNGTNNTISDGTEQSAHDGCLFSKGPLTIKGTGNLNINGNQSAGEGIATKDNTITINESNISIHSVDDGINSGGSGGTITINSGTLYIESGGDAIDSNKDVIINGGALYAYAGLTGINSSIDVDDKYIVNGGTIVALGNDHLILPDSSSKGKILCFEKIDAIAKDKLITLVNESNDVVFSFTTKADINTILYASDNLANGKYYLYSGGTIENNKYDKGEIISIKGNNEYIVDKNINSYME